MIELAADSWARALERISTRHKGIYIVVRVYEGAQEPAGVVLWHIPLQSIRLTEDECVEIKAGDPVTPIVYTTNEVHAVFAEFSGDREHVRQIQFDVDTGDRIVMEFGP